MSIRTLFLPACLCAALACPATAAAPATPGASVYDEALARQLGADQHGMRKYVLVILKTGPTPVPKGEARDAMFRGHFANMQRLADAGVLVQAGPLDGVDGWRGLFVLAVDSIDAAREHVASDPVVSNGEMVPEFHTYYGSAALMRLNAIHNTLVKPEQAP